MSLRSFLSKLTASGAVVPSSVPRGEPGSFTRGVTLGVGTVRNAALSADGARVAVATSLGVAVFPTTGEREIWSRETENWACSVAFSADGSRVIAGTVAGRARVWNAADGQPIATLTGEGKLQVALDADGTRAAIGQRTGVVLWDVGEEAPLRPLIGTQHEVSAVAFSAAGDRVAAADYHGQVLVWEARSGRELARFRPDEMPLRAVAFSADGTLVAACGKDWTVWELTMGATIQSGTAPGPLISVAFSGDGERLITGSKRNRGHIWNASSGELEHEAGGHIDEVHSVAFADDASASDGAGASAGGAASAGATASASDGASDGASGDDGGCAGDGDSTGGGARRRVLLASQKVDWTDGDTGTVAGALPTLARAMHIAFDESSTALALADKQLITVWDPRTGAARAVLDGHTHTIGGVAWSGDTLVSRSPREIIGWNPADGTRRYTLRGVAREPGRDHGHVGGAWAMSDHTLVAAIEEQAGRYTLGVWDARSGDRQRELPRLVRRGSGIDELVASPDGRHVAIRSGPRVSIRELASGDERCAFEGVVRRGGCVSWTPDGQLIAALGDGSVKFFDPASGRARRSLAGDGSKPAGLVLGRDGSLLAGWFNGRPGDRVTVWDARTGKPVWPALPREGGDTCHALALSPDNRTLVAGFSGAPGEGRESGLWVAWHMATGQVASSERGPAIWATAFSPGGDALVTASGDGQATVWRASS